MVILLLLHSFLLLPSTICSSPFSPPLLLSQSLSFSLWRSCNWFSSVYSFFKTGFETWEADKSHTGPSFPSVSSTLRSFLSSPLALTISQNPVNNTECGGMPPPKLFRQHCCHPTLPVLPLLLFLFLLHLFLPPLSRPPLPLSWLSDHIPLTELKSCITLKTHQCIVGRLVHPN